MERFPSWSPDGKTIAYFSDESGEYALHLAPQNGIGDVTKIPMPEPGFYRSPQWSPDSKKIAFIDSHMRIWYVDLEQRKPVQVDKERYWNPFGDDWVPVWSPDSKWLAYATRLSNYLGAIHVYSLASGKATQITDGMSDAKYPVFDKDGKYLYFTASTDSGPSLQPDVGSFTQPGHPQRLPCGPHARISRRRSLRRAMKRRWARLPSPMNRSRTQGPRRQKRPTSGLTSRTSASGFSACPCLRAAMSACRRASLACSSRSRCSLPFPASRRR